MNSYETGPIRTVDIPNQYQHKKLHKYKDSIKETFTVRKMVITPRERPETIIPSPKFPITRNPDELVEEQILVWVVSNQSRLWLAGIPET